MRGLAALCGGMLGGAMLAALVALTPAAAPAQQGQGPVWQSIGVEQSRLLLDASAFGTTGIDRWVVSHGGARYERWATRFDPSQRFFQIMLREADRGAVIQDSLDLRQKVLDTWGGRQPERIEWGQQASMPVMLGTAQYLPFTFSDIGCTGFLIPFGGMARGPTGPHGEVQEVPRSTVEGMYCDPAFTLLPPFDIQATLNAIGVRNPI